MRAAKRAMGRLNGVFLGMGMRHLKIAISALVFSAGGAFAQNTTPGAGAPEIIPDSAKLIPGFDTDSITSVLNDLGVAWQLASIEGQTMIQANFGGTANFVMLPAACNTPDSRCVGLTTIAVFNGKANPQTVTAFNYYYDFLSAGVNPEGVAYLRRYDLADYGIPRGNLASSIVAFATLIGRFSEELASSQRTVSLQGYAEDLSARSLNQSTLAAFSGVVNAPTTHIEAHASAFDDAVKITEILIDDAATPRNKINNQFD